MDEFDCKDIVFSSNAFADKDYFVGAENERRGEDDGGADMRFDGVREGYREKEIDIGSFCVQVRI
jgi:nucleoside-diphosphate-sugar epimerase